MQFQSDILNLTIDRPDIVETTAVGAAFLAGLAVSFWQDEVELERVRKTNQTFSPAMDEQKASNLIAEWQHAVQKCIS